MVVGTDAVRAAIELAILFGEIVLAGTTITSAIADTEPITTIVIGGDATSEYAVNYRRSAPITEPSAVAPDPKVYLAIGGYQT